APSPGARPVLRDFANPVGRLDVDPSNDAAWICDSGSPGDTRPHGALLHRLPTGDPAPPPYILGLDDPIDVAVSTADGSVWECEGLGAAVHHYSPSGSLLGVHTGLAASRVAVDPPTGEAWVTSFP